MRTKVTFTQQPYPRINNEHLALGDLFPRQNPALSQDVIIDSIRKAFVRAGKNKRGKPLKVWQTPDQLVKLCIKHLKERSDPILSTFFYSEIKVEDVFDMDAIAHEMQRNRMKIGVFYQYLLIELIKQSRDTDNSVFTNVFDGSREGDIVADISPPSFDEGLRLYISVKKSIDTVGGQDIAGVIRRLESLARQEKNLTSPYMCVIAIATPPRGKLQSYDASRIVKSNADGNPHSVNCEFWLPGFIYPYITGLSAIEVYKKSIEEVMNYMPFFTLNARDEATDLLKQKFIDLEIADQEGTINKQKFFEFICK